MKKLLRVILTACLLMTLCIPVASAKNVSSGTVASGQTLEVKRGNTLTVPAGETLTLSSGSVLKVNGKLKVNGRLVIRQGARVYQKEDGSLKLLIGTKADADQKSALIGISEGTVVRKGTTYYFKNGLYYVGRSGKVAKDVTWKFFHEVSMIYGKGVAVDVNIKGPKNNTSETQYDFAKLDFKKGSSNRVLNLEAGKTYWWMSVAGKAKWHQFNYMDMYSLLSDNKLDFVVDVLSNPVGYGTVARKWAACMANNNESGTQPAWTDKDGTKYANLVYDKSRSEQNSYDLYVPKNAKKNTGVILFLHGGGWADGEKADMDYMAMYFARKGYITATMDYRLYESQTGLLVLGQDLKVSDMKLTDLLDDVEHCVNAIQKKTKKLGFSCTKLGVGGYSAGGHLAQLYGYSRPDAGAIPVKLVLSMNGPTDLHPDAFSCVSWAEYLKDGIAGYLCQFTNMTAKELNHPNKKQEAWLRTISPVYHVTSNSVPTVALYASFDETIGLGHRDRLYASLTKAGVDSTFIQATKSDHPLELDHAKILEFLNTSAKYAGKYLS